MTEPKIAWESGDSYERYVGRWSRLVARDFLEWLQVATGSSRLDVGCGTGELAKAIVETQSPSLVVGVDPSEAFISFAREQVQGERAEFRVGDAQSLPYEDRSLDVTIAGLVLNHLPEAASAATEMARVTRVGGLVAAYVWDYADKMQMMRHFWDVAVALDPAALKFDQRYPICHPDALADLFRNAALRDVQTRAIDVATVFRDFDDYWTPFLGGQGVAPGYAMSLSATRRAALRERIRASLPVASDASISLVARAWAVKGTACPYDWRARTAKSR